MNKLLVMLAGVMALGWGWAENEAVKGYPKNWSGEKGKLENGALSICSEVGAAYTAKDVAKAECVRTTIKLASRPIDEADLAAFCVPTNAKFVVCLVCDSANRLAYELYARTQPEGTPVWTKLEGLTPLADAENELTVEYVRATKEVKVIGATNAATFYSLNPKSAYQAKTTFQGAGKVSSLTSSSATPVQ